MNGLPLSEQLRRIIASAGISRYRLAKESQVDAGQLCRFMQGNGQLTFETLDRIGNVLGLRLEADSANGEDLASPQRKPRTGKPARGGKPKTKKTNAKRKG